MRRRRQPNPADKEEELTAWNVPFLCARIFCNEHLQIVVLFQTAWIKLPCEITQPLNISLMDGEAQPRDLVHPKHPSQADRPKLSPPSGRAPRSRASQALWHSSTVLTTESPARDEERLDRYASVDTLQGRDGNPASRRSPPYFRDVNIDRYATVPPRGVHEDLAYHWEKDRCVATGGFPGCSPKKLEPGVQPYADIQTWTAAPIFDDDLVMYGASQSKQRAALGDAVASRQCRPSGRNPDSVKRCSTRGDRSTIQSNHSWVPPDDLLMPALEGGLDRYDSVQSVRSPPPKAGTDASVAKLSVEGLDRYESVASVVQASTCTWASQSLDRYASVSSTGIDLSLGLLSLDSSSDDPFNEELRRRCSRTPHRGRPALRRAGLRTGGCGDRATTSSSWDCGCPSRRYGTEVETPPFSATTHDAVVMEQLGKSSSHGTVDEDLRCSVTGYPSASESSVPVGSGVSSVTLPVAACSDSQPPSPSRP